MKMDFHDWINQKFREWRGDAIGHEKTLQDFAQWLGISKSLLTYWRKKNGKIPTHKKSIDKLVEKYGIEVYDVLGLEQPDIITVGPIPHQIRDDLSTALYEINSELISRGLSSNSPEAIDITINILEKHWLRYTRTTKS